MLPVPKLGPRLGSLLLTLAIVDGSGCTPEPAPPLGTGRSAVLVDGTYGTHRYKLFVPSGYSAGRPTPLVMMLHGCTQDAAQFANGTQYHVLAESQGFIVVYPELSTGEDPSRCWSWYQPAHQARGSGQPAWLTGLVGELGKSYTLDRSRVYVGGLSAGAAMAVILGATYPDVFAAIAVGSGLEYRAASGSGDALSAMRSGGPSPDAQGRTAYRAMGAAARVVPVIVFHGTSDGTVAPVNADQVIAQWAKTDDLAADGMEDGTISTRPDATTGGTVPGGRSYTRASYLDHRTGAETLVKVLVQSMGHAWSGGSSSGSFTDPRGPSATQLSWEFFRGHRIGSIDPPTDGGVIDSGTRDMAAPTDLRTPDLGTPDLGTPDLGTPDLGTPDLGTPDLGTPVDLGPPPLRIGLPALAGESGFVGQLAADGIAVGVPKAGDKGLFNSDTYRAILSFDVGALPAGSPRSAELWLTRRSQSGVVSSVAADIRVGAFGRDAALQSDDYAAAASTTGAASFTPPARDGDTVRIPLSPALLGPLPGRRLQIRLRATTPIDFKADAIEWTAPTLLLVY